VKIVRLIINNLFFYTFDNKTCILIEYNKKFYKRLQENDPIAWRELINSYSDRLYAYALSLSSDHDVSSDIIQQVFINLFESKDRLDPKYSLKSFLYRSTYNQFVDNYRKKKSMSILHEQYYHILDQFITNTDEEDFSKKINLLNDLIGTLPLKTKEVFILSKSDGLTNAEISEILDISIKTVEGHITRAFKLLRKMAKSLDY
jgi:RNA polymerase sigma-70 factor (ECF subfamily)